MRNVSFFAALIVCAAGALQANASVQNGSFENPTTLVFTTVPNGTAPGDIIPNWGVGLPGSGVSTTPGAGVDVVLAGAGGILPSPAADGNQYIDLTGTSWSGDAGSTNQNGNIFQTIPTAANQWYQLTFEHASSLPGGSTGAYTIWDGDWNNIVADINDPGFIGGGFYSDAGNAVLDWVTSTVLFQAKSASTTIVFGAILPEYGNAGHLLDNVSVALVPEPATVFVWSVLGLAAAGVSYKRARKNAAVNS